MKAAHNSPLGCLENRWADREAAGKGKHEMMDGFGTMGLFGGWWMLLGMLALLALLALGVFLLAGTAQQRGRLEDTALDILKKRYAAGELSPAEFELAKKGLG